MNERKRDDEALERELSTLYRELGGDEPPPALDDAILRAARAETGARRQPLLGRGALSAAAGIVVAVLTAVLFAGLGERVAVEYAAKSDFAVEGFSAPVAQAPEPDGRNDRNAQAETADAPAGLAPGPLVEPRRDQDEPFVTRVIVIGPEGRVMEERTRVPTPAPAAEPDALRMRMPGQDALREEVAQAPAAESGVAPADRPPPSAPGAGGPELQELLQMVETARLTETEEMASRAPRVRAAEDWLAAIQELVDEERLIEAYGELETFKQAYPDVDYEAVLDLPPTLSGTSTSDAEAAE